MNKNTKLILAGLTILTAGLGYLPLTQYYAHTHLLYSEQLSQNLSHSTPLERSNLFSIAENLPKSVIKQSYRHLYEGSSSIVFISEDNQYIFKILKQNTSSIPTLILPPGQDRNGPNNKDIDTTSLNPNSLRSKSYLLAIDPLQKETELIFLHLYRLQDLDTQLLVFDKRGKQQMLCLDDYAFLFQKKGEPIYQSITQWMRNNQIDKAKSLVVQIVKSVFTLCQQVVIDQPSNIKKHMACIDEQCFFMDLEHFQKQKEILQCTAYLQQVDQMIKPFEIWLKQKHPELAIELKNQITKLKQEHLESFSTIYEGLLQ